MATLRSRPSLSESDYMLIDVRKLVNGNMQCAGVFWITDKQREYV